MTKKTTNFSPSNDSGKILDKNTAIQQAVNEIKKDTDVKFDKLRGTMVDLKVNLVNFEKRMEQVVSNFADKLYTRIDPLLKEVEDSRIDRELTTEKFRTIEKRIDKLEKAVN